MLSSFKCYCILRKDLNKKMELKFEFKDEFTVMGILGEGPFHNCQQWIGPLWEKANANAFKLEQNIKWNDKGKMSVWGIMSDVNETFAPWDNKGKYLAGLEVKSDGKIVEEFTKWSVPASTYLVLTTNNDSYLKNYTYIIKEYMPKHGLELIGAQHEKYPEPGNPDLIELYFPISRKPLTCKECGMPMLKSEEFGHDKDGTPNHQVCCYCEG